MITRLDSPTGPRAALTGLGALLVGAPLIAGAGASVLALTGRFGGRDSAFTAFWYVAAALAPVALVGAVLLAFATWRQPGFRTVMAWSAVAAGGWVFGLGSAQVSGLADAAPADGVIWPYLLLGGGIAIYVVGLVALLVLARKHAVTGPGARGGGRDPASPTPAGRHRASPPGPRAGRSRTSPPLAFLAIAVVLALGACDQDARSGASGDPSPESASSTEPETSPEPDADVLDSEVPDLCALFTAEDFKAVTGEPIGVQETQQALGAIRGTCSTSAEAGFPLVMLAAYNEADRETTLSMVDAEPVDDLGVEAYWDETLGLVVPLEGKDWYLQVLATDGGADLATSVAVAEIALGRL